MWRRTGSVPKLAAIVVSAVPRTVESTLCMKSAQATISAMIRSVVLIRLGGPCGGVPPACPADPGKPKLSPGPARSIPAEEQPPQIPLEDSRLRFRSQADFPDGLHQARIGNVERVVAAEEHMVHTDFLDEEIERRDGMRDRVVVEAAEVLLHISLERH